MEQKIKELQQLFIEKLLKGEFEVESVDKYAIIVKVFDKQFCFWIGNWDRLGCFNQYIGVYYHFLDLELTDIQRMELYRVFYVLHGYAIEDATGLLTDAEAL